ncbi:hypothetical protein D3C85_1502890 [compost metagenome]
MARTARRRNHLVSCLRSVQSTKAVANRPIIRKPIPAMMRKTQNISGTLGTVSQAACLI